MSYLEIKNFKAGLERRQSELTTNPGALYVGENAHITQGGEFERRKAFVLQGALPRAVALGGGTVAGDTNGDTLNAYGLQSTAAGLLCFGSSDSTRNTVASGTPYNFPTGVTYQRLQHWTEAGSGYVLGGHNHPAMTGVTCSCAFDGKAFVVSSFGAGDVTLAVPASKQMHFDGTAVNQYSYGTMWIGGGNNGLYGSYSLYTVINTLSGYSAAFVGDAANSVDISGPSTQTIALTPSDTDGTVTLLANSSIPQSAAVAAVSAKTIVDITVWVTGTRTLTIIDGIAGSTPICPATAASVAGSLALFVIAVVKAINNGGSGYTATWSVIASGTALSYRITIVAPLSYGATTLTPTITVSAGSGTITTSAAAPFSGGTSAIAGNAVPGRVSFTATTWTVGATWTVVMTANGISYTLGAGNINGLSPTYCMAVGNKVYFTVGNQFFFSKIQDATKWEDQDTGAGFITVKDRFSDPQSLVALATYQGKLAAFSRWATQIWTIDADPANYSQGQSLQNIGTLAALSVQSLGDLDVLFLSDTGVRSLRVRDASNNAIISDVGSPIDELVQANLIAGSNNSSACSVVEPLSNRYWLFLNDTIYVFSYYPTNKVLAWSTYLPQYDVTGAAISASANYAASVVTYAGLTIGQVYKFTFGANEVSMACGSDTLVASGYFTALATTVTVTGNAPTAAYTGTLQTITQTTFTPEKFVVHQGKVYVLATDGKVFLYGGSANATYDSCVATAELPYLDASTPGTMKTSQSLEVVGSGTWTLSGCMSPSSNTMVEICKAGNKNAPSLRVNSLVEGPDIPWSAKGTHFKLKAVSRVAAGQTAFYAGKICSLIWHYQGGK